MEQRKRLEITEAMLEQIQRVTGTSLSASDIVVYEAAALSTRPLHKPGSIFHGARPTREMLLDMAQGVRSGTHSVPMHTLHQQGSELPVGRVFDGDVVEEPDGSSTLLAKFYLPASEVDLVSKIDLAVLDEVSVGVKSKQALCSKCGFDYFGEDAGFEYLWDQTCPDGHTIGQGGAHLRLVGLDHWMEMSLVSRGASDNPKIRTRVREVMPKTTYDRLAASGRPVEAMMLFTQNPMEIKKPMDAETKALLEGLSGKLEAIEARLSAEPEPIEAEVGTLELTEAQILDLSVGEIKVADLQAQAATAAELQAQLDAANARVAELETPEPEPTPAPAPVQIETPVLPVGGVAASAVSDAKNDVRTLQASAFKTNRKPNRH